MEKQQTEKKKFLSLGKWTTKDYGKNAITGLLGGAIIVSIHGIVFNVIGEILVTAGLICGVIWVVKVFQDKKARKAPVL